jgi:hypothetical protein
MRYDHGTMKVDRARLPGGEGIPGETGNFGRALDTMPDQSWRIPSLLTRQGGAGKSLHYACDPAIEPDTSSLSLFYPRPSSDHRLRLSHSGIP